MGEPAADAWSGEDREEERREKPRGGTARTWSREERKKTRKTAGRTRRSSHSHVSSGCVLPACMAWKNWKTGIMAPLRVGIRGGTLTYKCRGLKRLSRCDFVACRLTYDCAFDTPSWDGGTIGWCGLRPCIFWDLCSHFPFLVQKLSACWKEVDNMYVV